MFVSSTTGGESAGEIIAASPKLQQSTFSHILNKQIAESVRPADASVATQGSQIGNKTPIPQHHLLTGAISTQKPFEKHEPLLLGTISKDNPTVSDLMIRHPVYGKDCWKILHSRTNRNKAYTSIPNGSRIYLDPKTLEVVWNHETASGNAPQIVNDIHKDVAPVFLGTISKSDPTVSDLMIRHPVYGKDCWKILHSRTNRNKAYTSIPNGSRIYLDPKTLEVVWNRETGTAQTVIAGQPDLRAGHLPSNESDSFSNGLAKAVKPYLGKSYKEMNCFELVVQGLEGVGIPYYGRGGLGERLVKMAMEKDLSMNYYLSGEGLVETSGSEIYTKSVPRISNSKREAHEVYHEVEPLLQEGLILSFSTPTRGHTGIVSRKKQYWTYINSGRMDNHIEGTTSKGVGEEFLKAEIGNWFRLAANRNEPLQITVGRLDKDKLRALLPGLQASRVGIPEFSPERQKPHTS